MTYGEKAVGLNFNPGGDEMVAKLKRLYAEIIDICHKEQAAYEKEPSEKHFLFSIAIREAQGAQMWAVKAVTWRDE